MKHLLVVLVVSLAMLALRCNTRTDDTMSASDKRARIQQMYSEYKSEFPNVVDLTPADAERLRKEDDALLVDVRTPAERAVSMIPGAISREEFEARKEALEDRPIIAHCTIGYRSGVFAEELAAQGYESYNLAGSILAWVHEGYRVVDPATGESTRRVHTYGPEWDLLPENYEAIW